MTGARAETLKRSKCLELPTVFSDLCYLGPWFMQFPDSILFETGRIGRAYKATASHRLWSFVLQRHAISGPRSQICSIRISWVIILYSNYLIQTTAKISSFSRPGCTLGDCRSSKGRKWIRHFAGQATILEIFSPLTSSGMSQSFVEAKTSTCNHQAWGMISWSNLGSFYYSRIKRGLGICILRIAQLPSQE